MGRVFRERREVRRPNGTYVNHCDGRVFIMNGGNHKSRITIGWATSEDYFHPNDKFKILFPNEWEEAFAEYDDPKMYELHAGMYGLCLGAGYKSGLYPCLIKAYDGLHAGNIMDYAMYSILQRSDVSQLFSERMREEVLFSEEVWSSAYWSRLFKDGLKCWQHDKFKDLWLKNCIARGMKRTWICIDGSNNDCQMQESTYAEYGENKSHSSKPVVGFIYAIDAETGEPITYFVNPGSIVDSQAFQNIIHFLVGYNLDVEGVILDRGFCTYEVLMTLRKLEIKYMIMVPAGVRGYKDILKECGMEIFWKSKHLVNTKGVFGISKEEVIWAAYPEVKGILNLYFGAVRGCFEGVELLEDVLNAKEKAEKKCASGEIPKIEKKYRDILHVRETEDGLSVECDYNAWDVSLRQTGYFSILSSDDFGPETVYNTYQLRMASETQYSIMKSQEGFDTTRVHTDPGMLSKYAVCFVACVLRHWIMEACQKQSLDTNEMIQSMDRIRFMVNEAGKAILIRDFSANAKKLFGEFAMDAASFEEIASDYNSRRSAKMKSEIRELPAQKETVLEKPRRGRPFGSKNKKTLEREAEIAKAKENGTYQEVPARKGGRPIGSKDSAPRKKRSDAGIKRGSRTMPAENKIIDE